MYLAYFQIRNAIKGPSYIDLHRDTFPYIDKSNGKREAKGKVLCHPHSR